MRLTAQNARARLQGFAVRTEATPQFAPVAGALRAECALVKPATGMNPKMGFHV